MVTTTQGDRDRLDAAVRTFVRANARCRAADIQKDPDVVRALGLMPPGKPDFRYLDASLQRVRKAGSIECATGGYWSAAKARRR